MRSNVYIFVVFLFVSCNSQKTSFDDSTRKIPFNTEWKFYLSDNHQDTLSGKEKWRDLDLPHDWSIEGEFKEDNPSGVSGGYLPGGVGWYKKYFHLNPEDSTKIISLLFDGVYRNSKVWINGHYLGHRPNGYIGFQYNLTPFLKYGRTKNEITVRVDNSDQPNSRWYTGAGIYRNVWLKKTNPLHVDQWGTFIRTPIISEKRAEIQWTGLVINEDFLPKEFDIGVTIFEAGGERELARQIKKGVSIKDKEEIYLELEVKDPKLWSVDNPNLYMAVVDIKSRGHLVDRYKTTFGIRSFKFDTKKGFFLNHKHLKIKGVSLHHDLGPLGTAVNKRAIERQLKIMQDMGVNAIRTTHNPPAPELLDLADKMGFMVMDEAFDVWEESKTKYDYSQYFKRWHKRDLEDQIRRDRNHPSVIMWSIGNEIPEQWSERGAIIGRELSQIVRKLDTTRPITAGMNPPITMNDDEGDVTLQFQDTAAKPNALAGSGALDVIGYNYAHQTYEDHLINFPSLPFIASETNSGLATRGYYDFPSDTTLIWPVRWDKEFLGGNSDNTVSAFDQVRTPWGALHKTTWNIIRKQDYLTGMFIWTGIDYIGEPTPYTWPSRSSYFGLVDLAGFPKDSYYYYKSEWTDTPVLHVFPHWNWEKDQLVDIWAYYNNADEVELFVNGKSLGKKHKEEDSHVMWRTRFAPGTLYAVSRKNGIKVKDTTIYTAGKPDQLELKPSLKQLQSDGKDLSFVTVNILDVDGNIVPTAANTLRFEIEGKGDIVGVASGDPTNHQSFKGETHSALAGKAMVIVKSRNKPGKIVLRVSAEGVPQGAKTVIKVKGT